MEKYAVVFTKTSKVVATFWAIDAKRAASMARGLVKFWIKDVPEAESKDDFRLRPAKALKAAAPAPAAKQEVKVIPSNPKYRSKYAPVRVKAPRAVMK